MIVAAWNLGKSRKAGPTRSKWSTWLNENMGAVDASKRERLWKGFLLHESKWEVMYNELVELQCLGQDILDSLRIVFKSYGPGYVLYTFATGMYDDALFRGLNYHLFAIIDDDVTAVQFKLAIL